MKEIINLIRASAIDNILQKKNVCEIENILIYDHTLSQNNEPIKCYHIWLATAFSGN